MPANHHQRVVPCRVNGDVFCFDSKNVLNVSNGEACELLDFPMDNGIAGELKIADRDVPVFCVQTLLGCPPQGIRTEVNLVVASTSFGECGFLVDDVLRGRDALSIAPFPTVARNAEKPYFSGIARWENDKTQTVSANLLLDCDGMVGESTNIGPDFSVVAEAGIAGLASEVRHNGQLMLFDLPHRDWNNQVISVALSVTQVLEITQRQSLMTVPLAPNEFLGFVQWRDYFVPVVDLTRQMALDTLPEAASNRLVIVRTQSNELIGFESCNSIRSVNVPVESSPFVMQNVSEQPWVRGTYFTPDGVFVVPSLEFPAERRTTVTAS